MILHTVKGNNSHLPIGKVYIDPQDIASVFVTDDHSYIRVLLRNTGAFEVGYEENIAALQPIIAALA